MDSLTIRCHPCVPVPVPELERWLELELEKLRAELPRLRARVLRLTQPLPGDEVPVGWLLECDLPGDEPVEQRLLTTLTDMRLLGLQPTLLRRAWEPEDSVARGFGTEGRRVITCEAEPPVRAARDHQGAPS